MWQEARKQEKILRGIMVDYKRRAERRKGYYEKIKKDPAEFLQLWGRQSKIHLDANISAAADNPSIMTKWRGDEDTLIDRFDVRSHLDYLEEYKGDEKSYEENLTESEKNEQRMLNYERYRTLVQNEAVEISETQCLKQIEIDEKYGGSAAFPNTNEKKIKEPKAQIGYSYEDSSYHHMPLNLKTTSKQSSIIGADDFSEDENEDLDMALDINKLTSEHKIILNKCATNYGMQFGDYIRMLILENEEKEALRQNKLLEAEKAQYSGRKSRRERRIAKDKRLKERGDLSPLSYIVKNTEKEKEEASSRSSSSTSSSKSSRSDSKKNIYSSAKKKYSKNKRSSSMSSSKSRSRSRSCSPKVDLKPKNKIMFITSFDSATSQTKSSLILPDEDEFIPINNNNIKLESSFKAAINIPTSNPGLKLKLLKQEVAKSKSRSKSPSPVTFKKNKTANNSYKISRYCNKNEKSSERVPTDEENEDDDASSDDEEEALKKYLKRRENRINVDNISMKTKAKQINEIKKNQDKDTDLNKINKSFNNGNNSCTSSKFGSAESFKLYHEKLKKKMQKKINEQLKKDHKIEREKKRKVRDERLEREAEINYLTEKVRQHRAKERRKKRDANGDDYYSRSRSRTRSRTRSRSRSPYYNRNRSYNEKRTSRSKSRSRSRSFTNIRKRSSSIDRSRYRKTNRSRSSSLNNRRKSRSTSRNRKSVSRDRRRKSKSNSPNLIRKRTARTSSSSSSKSSNSSSTSKNRSSSSSSNSSSSNSSRNSSSKSSRSSRSR